MFGTWFYHKRVRTAVSVFGSLFNNIHVLRENSAGAIISQVKVPLSYAPKRNFMDRISQMSQGEEAERKLAVKLPRMSFEITSMEYDLTRQLPKTNTFSKSVAGELAKKKKFYTSVPYNIGFQLNVYAKSQDDALQIVEQILPYFAPQYTVTVKPFSDYPDIKEDVPITMTSVDFQDDYEGPLEQRRTIIYTLNFEMKINLYGPDNTGPIIRQVNNYIFNQEAGLRDSDLFLENIRITPKPLTLSADSDFGFEVTIIDSAGPSTVVTALPTVVDSAAPPVVDSAGPATYSLSAPAIVEEGQTLTITLNTQNVADSSTVPYTIDGIGVDDIGGPLTGNFTIIDNTASIFFEVNEDLLDDSGETLRIRLDNGEDSARVSIIDTSKTPIPTYTLTSIPADAIDEGSEPLIIILQTTNVSDNTRVGYTITGVSDSDIDIALTGGGFQILDDSDRVEINITEDAFTEGAETLTLSLDDDSASISIVIGDISTTPDSA